MNKDAKNSKACIFVCARRIMQSVLSIKRQIVIRKNSASEMGRGARKKRLERRWMRSWSPAKTSYDPKGLECQTAGTAKESNQASQMALSPRLGRGLELNQGHPIVNAHGCRQDITRIQEQVPRPAIPGRLAAVDTSRTDTTAQHSSGIRHLVSQLVYTGNVHQEHV